MGVFLYATYLFVKSSVRENKSYVKSVTNYLKEYDGISKQNKSKKAKDLESLFKITSATEGRLNVAI
jgi:hypothetical protein